MPLICEPKHEDIPSIETYNIGENTYEQLVGSEQIPALRNNNIIFTGTSIASDEFSFVRLKPDLSQILITVKGQGEVYTEDGWQPLPEGHAYITPRDIMHAYRGVSRKMWTVCWVTYHDPKDIVPTVSLDIPTITQANPKTLYAAITGLNEEYRSKADPHKLEIWSNLVHDYVSTILESWRIPDRLWYIWDHVNRNLNKKWCIQSLAKYGHISPEYLRVLCRKHHNTSPMNYVAYLRMQHAANLLKRTNLKLEAIAITIGYDNAFSFSRAFKRIMGYSPMAYRSL
ncbi:Bifunctional transcriptional activator/DNA repair enzyme AdaA [Poriferisphaera corsica]|uniref:Bifunctional transcriptional activator/DNA repair enzyme AdaA n=1 Tax=Poriferisphaera corsica TaxID=2528020 RepID=A0A517YT76_9BACT|nr:AraC family transcriptional regulator [Poriferisphaera corsica]QDU33439.1 Bifunctional transcriptional activator/DNA repair enzyme AdaA [Poriferisphaera corsica]